MSTPIPLCVDLDGTLLRTDTMSESLLKLLKENPLRLLQMPLWLVQGRASIKQKIASRTRLDVASLPINEEVLAYIEKERQAGRKLLLVSGTDIKVARAMAEHIPVFEEVYASDGTRNLSGHGKADMLRERFGKGGFDYAGNARVDLPVWAQARRALVVNEGGKLARKAETLCEVEKVFDSPQVGLRTWTEALRVHQWAKNLLLFVPLLGAHRWHNYAELGASALAFFAFCMCASSVYLLNDLFDLESDRYHPTKRRRPLASGRLPLSSGMIAAALLLIFSILIALLLPVEFGITFAGYYLLTSLYSVRLKQIEILDVLTLAALYSVRVVAGGYAARIMVSDWLLAFSLFIFLSLAFVKRFTELQLLKSGEIMRGRGYRVADRELVSTMGVASGYFAVLVLALYITQPLVTQLYRHPAALWFACPVLLYWISRIWLLAHHGQLHDDPIVFALKDKQSWLVCLILLAVGAIALPR
ncbi:UbiA prenyltransferase [Chthoniobacter flavus Ellin428]|uniref:UbiA prenyltransferase n=1 Tax=Chthoniobacter flavus Ellin428 TaxID=497964 RepID=B4D8P1_9BACT|nr:UbiA family prenyltransferase [Chthoniobacter flavus]EDY17263.1 UbiA prenyltransferase [Chthoniobacter flavus Ellin428]TCO86914.1 4-hydroxybenzoate polyprenyltransferase [Chthoniobacter flavus]